MTSGHLISREKDMAWTAKQASSHLKPLGNLPKKSTCSNMFGSYVLLRNKAI